MTNLKSQVEKRQNEVKIGTELTYIDSCNCESFKVTDTFDGGFEAENDYEVKDFYFEELQMGWNFK